MKCILDCLLRQEFLCKEVGVSCMLVDSQESCEFISKWNLNHYAASFIDCFSVSRLNKIKLENMSNYIHD